VPLRRVDRRLSFLATMRIPDSFVRVWTIEQRNVVHWFGINADIDDRKPARRNCKKTSASARDLQTPKQRELNLLDTATEWKASSTSEGLFEGLDRGTGEIKWIATRVDLVFGFNSQLRAIAEVYASANSKKIFLKDFVAAWNKIMDLDRYYLHKRSSPVILQLANRGLPRGSPSACPELANEIPIRPRSHFSESRAAFPSDLGKRLGRKNLNLLNLRRFSK
jgi:hypothetical protein